MHTHLRTQQIQKRDRGKLSSLYIFATPSATIVFGQRTAGSVVNRPHARQSFSVSMYIYIYIHLCMCVSSESTEIPHKVDMFLRKNQINLSSPPVIAYAH